MKRNLKKFALIVVAAAFEKVLFSRLFNKANTSKTYAFDPDEEFTF